MPTKETNKETPYGAWKSPISTESLTQKIVSLNHLFIELPFIYWTESRPFEKGRNVLMQYNTQTKKILEILPKNKNIKSNVHEYGGIAFTVFNECIYFVNNEDQNIYSFYNNQLTQITYQSENPLLSFVDLQATPNYLIAIVEKKNQNKENDNFLTSIDIKTGKLKPLHSDFNFYTSPTLNKELSKVAWVCWNHPNMPWNGSELWTADIKNGEIFNEKKIAGGKTTSIFQPQWSPNSTLYYVSDKNGWWNLYRYQKKQKKEELILEMEAEFGLPQWVFGMSTWSFTNEDIICCYTQKGQWFLGKINIKEKKLQKIQTESTLIEQVRGSQQTAVFLESSVKNPTSISILDTTTLLKQKIYSCDPSPVSSSFLSSPNSISYKNSNNQLVHALFYPPYNKHTTPKKNSLPPLIVKAHGGPTGASYPSYDLKTQFWTSRGFAVLDVNYSGSTGHGKAYQKLLENNWGVLDVDDCIFGVQHLIKQKLVDPNKIAIRGSSSGGLTLLSAIAKSSLFSAAACYYGVSDLKSLVNDTHKFEAHYLDQLIGPYPQEKKIYEERSPFNFCNKISCPVIFFQGLKDKVVPPEQSKKMVNKLKKNNVYVEYVEYPQEGHGFRTKDAIQDSLNKELKFYLFQ